MKKSTKLFIAAFAASMLMPQMMKAQLLKGVAKLGTEYEFAVNYKPGGNLFAAKLIDITPAEDGSYTFDINMEEDEADVDIYVDNSVFGAHLQKGKTAIFNVERTPDYKYITSFGGDNAGISEVVSAMSAAYDLMTYSSPDSDGSGANEQLVLLDAAHKATLAKLKLIKDKKKRAYYNSLCEANYIGTKARVIEDRNMAAKTDAKEDPEYIALINKINPNSDVDVSTCNFLLWVASQKKVTPEFKGNMLPDAIETMDIVEKYITNPNARKIEAQLIPNSFFAYGDHETGKDEFWTRYKEFAKDYPEFIEMYTPEYNKVVKKFDGQPLPEFTIENKAGEQFSNSILKGKFTYVDVWATWCGPCCKQIPFIEKLVEQMADNDMLQFVSFSVDADRNAWEKKLEKDQPKWAQYILGNEANKILSDALTINGIPRFFVLDPEGNVINSDAMRPSEEGIAEYLNELTGK